jgi:hypothetical protein
MGRPGRVSGSSSGPALERIIMRFLLRFIGLLLLALAFIFVVYDGIRSISDGNLLITKASYIWNAINDHSLQAVQSLVTQRAGAEVWQLGVEPILDQPASAIAAVLGVIFIILGRKKKPLIGYARD